MCIVNHIPVVEIQAGDYVVALGFFGLFLNGEGVVVLIEFDHTVGARVSHLVGEDSCAVLLFVFGQLGAEPVPVENIVAKHEGNGAITNKICTKNKCLSQPVRGGLHLVFEVNPES